MLVLPLRTLLRQETEGDRGLHRPGGELDDASGLSEEVSRSQVKDGATLTLKQIELI